MDEVAAGDGEQRAVLGAAGALKADFGWALGRDVHLSLVICGAQRLCVRPLSAGSRWDTRELLSRANERAGRVLLDAAQVPPLSTPPRAPAARLPKRSRRVTASVTGAPAAAVATAAAPGALPAAGLAPSMNAAEERPASAAAARMATMKGLPGRRSLVLLFTTDSRYSPDAHKCRLLHLCMTRLACLHDQHGTFLGNCLSAVSSTDDMAFALKSRSYIAVCKRSKCGGTTRGGPMVGMGAQREQVLKDR